MPSFHLHLAELVSNPDETIDFARLDAEEIMTHLAAIYDFLGTGVEIALESDAVTLSIPDPHPFQIGEANRTQKRAQRASEKGNYAVAVQTYKEVLSSLPALTGARRDLAMVYMETGNFAASRGELIRVLRLQPDDAWAWLILGNIAVKQDDTFRAHRYYQRAYQLAPDDLYILNSYAGLQAKQGDIDSAISLFDRALTIDPNYPNARYGLALSYDRAGRMEDAELQLRELFAQSHSQDIRSEPVYQQARALYLDLQARTAEAAFQVLMDRLQDLAWELEQQVGIPIRFQEDERLSVAAVAQVAWIHGRSEHLIRFRPTNKAILPHRIAHEIEHLRMIHEARAAGRNRLFSTTPETNEYARRQVDIDHSRLRQMGMSEGSIQEYLTLLISGLASQLLNNPLDMVIEDRLYRRYEFLRASQFVSVEDTYREGLQAIQQDDMRRMTPNRVFAANTTMNAAFALFLDGLWGGFTEYAGPYRDERTFADARKLFLLWQAAMPVMRPGDEYDLVDRFGQVLRLQNWYIWREDIPDMPEPDAEIWADIDVDEAEAKGIAAEKELFQLKEPATLMYLLGALERFDAMPQDAVVRTTAEIAILGRTGLDYTSPDRKYTLTSVPGEYFSGLQLMCLMYVGLKRTAPDVDPGMPFADTYRAALALHRGRQE